MEKGELTHLGSPFFGKKFLSVSPALTLEQFTLKFSVGNYFIVKNLPKINSI